MLTTETISLIFFQSIWKYRFINSSLEGKKNRTFQKKRRWSKLSNHNIIKKKITEIASVLPTYRYFFNILFVRKKRKQVINKWSTTILYRSVWLHISWEYLDKNTLLSYTYYIHALYIKMFIKKFNISNLLGKGIILFDNLIW